MEKVPGVKLESIFSDLPSSTQDTLVAQLAIYMLELSHHNFSSIGSLFFPHLPPTLPASPCLSSDGVMFPSVPSTVLGPLTHSSFYIDGRASLPLDRGPFPTARAYFFACAQRELDCARALFTQGASEAYLRDLEEGQLQVERSVGLMHDLIRRCRGLDDEDPDLARFSLDMHELGLKSVIVSKEDPSKIVSIIDWQSTAIRPLWRCARPPHWLSPSLTGGNDEDQLKGRLFDVFRRTISEAEGPDSTFLRALDSDDTRHALDEVAEYDAFKDGFLVLPTLESMYVTSRFTGRVGSGMTSLLSSDRLATLPGEEDLVGLKKLLDPKTLTGRAARIHLMTQGSNALFLAMSPPSSPIQEKPPGGMFRRPIRYSLHS
ncbi:hypothetical protein EW146_g7751 [Bondarzewia mesenterica]|uniref:Uncharacterized protein n=1 Tax=Bondarzewia mesenterica TaxID=1095465 RepID=A0A4S4LKB8_9AGAM|nr:hypothetical protein EW146_g7751 [Bondarzewia mesenterica]